MTNKYGFSSLECKVILDQIERRDKYRKEFLKQRTDPCKHSQEAGYVFDRAIQNFVSMKATHLDFFPCNLRTIRFGLLAIVMPMTAFGCLLWVTRNNVEQEIRCGRLKYKDRQFKFK